MLGEGEDPGTEDGAPIRRPAGQKRRGERFPADKFAGRIGSVNERCIGFRR
jgi:hypothetical protein